MNLKESVVKRLLLITFAMLIMSGSYGQKIIGTHGLVNIPTADMYDAKTFTGGVNMVPGGMVHFDYSLYDYFLDFTPFSFVELTFRSTLMKMKNEKPSDSFCEQDRSFTVRLRPLNETKWIPAVVVGSNDFYSNMGHSYYSALYMVGTKHFDFAKVGEFGLNLGYSKSIFDGDIYDGVFYGVDFKPNFCRNARVMVDYDTKGINAGIEVLAFKHWNFLVCSRNMSKVGVGFSYQYTIKY